MDRPSTLFNIAVIMGLALKGQSAPSGRAFEVATIKAAPPITAKMTAAGKFHTGVKVDKAQLDIGYSSLSDLIRIAYNVKAYQVSGPAWLQDEKWDVLAKLPAGTSPDDAPVMLQVLLAERFNLAVHREKREEKVYALEVGADGEKVKTAAVDPDQEGENPLRISTSRDGKSTVVSGGGAGITRTQMQPDGSMHLSFSKMTMATLVDSLSYYMDRPVIDMTHLNGAYQIDLEVSAAELRHAAAKAGYPQYFPPADGTSELGASVAASMRKLGLELKQRQVPIEMIVVDHSDRAPSAN